MSDDEDENADWESAVALRAKAAHCMDLAKILSEPARTRLLQMADNCLERAAILEQRDRT